MFVNANRFQAPILGRFLIGLARYGDAVKGGGKIEISDRPAASGRLCVQAEKEVPQPQVPVALGLVNLKPPP
jgi:hypothetical protein